MPREEAVMAMPFTVIDADAGELPRARETSAEATGDAVRVPVEALGYELKPEGLCKGPLCHPIPAGQAPADGSIELADLEAITGRPVAVDAEAGAAFVGVAAMDRQAELASLEAPDFTLPDLDGKLHSLSEHRGKKVLLVAYASW
jgi:hypothetical protein